MDVPRGKEVARKRLIRRIALITGAVVVLGGISVAVARLKPAVPGVEMSGLWPGTVRRGPMEVNRRGLGALKPEEIHWIAAAQDSRVSKIVRRAGIDPVKSNDVILVLSDPDLELEAQKAEWALKQEEANLSNLKVKLESDKLDQRASLASLESQYTQAKLTGRLNLLSDLSSRLSVDQANQFQKRVEMQKERLKIQDESISAQIDAQKVVVESARAAYQLKRNQVDQLTIRSGIDGVLQEVNVEVGQRVAAGTILAKVADPRKLKAVLQIAETQMKEVRVGLDATVDTRNGIVPGRVVRIDPAALNGTVGVDVALLGSLPPSARPELSVDGTIEIERVPDVVFVDRPVSGEQDGTIGLFKLDPDGRYASQVKVKLALASVNTIQVKDGLKVGDKVILSDMSQYDQYQRIKLN